MSGLSEEIFQEGFKEGLIIAALILSKQGIFTLEEIASTLEIPIGEIQNYIKQHEAISFKYLIKE